MGSYFVCIPSRAVHLEPLQGMDIYSFRLALTRFTSIRGTCTTILSDQSTNFIGARNQKINVDLTKITHELSQKGIEWKINPSHASHFNGCIERKIASVRRVLEVTLLLMRSRGVSRDEFTTMLAEAASIVNNTPLWAVFTRPDYPAHLSSAHLLTLHEQPNLAPL